jgi:hypothetical protein
MSLKKNWPVVYADVEQLFAQSARRCGIRNE